MRITRQALNAVLLALLVAWAAVPTHAQAPNGGGSVYTLLRNAAVAYQANIAGALRGLIGAEQQLGASGGSVACAMPRTASMMHQRNTAQQRFGYALTQLIQAHGNPSGMATEVAGAFRALQGYDEAIANSTLTPANPALARQVQQMVNARYNAETRLANAVARWNAAVNGALPQQLRGPRQGMTTNMDAALRELASLDQQMVTVAGSASNNAFTANNNQARIDAMQQKNQDIERQLEAINHGGATKAAQDPNKLRLMDQLSQNKRDMANLQNQMKNSTSQQGQSNARQLNYLQKGRASAWQRFAIAIDQALHFDSQL